MINNTEPFIIHPEEIEDPVLALTRNDARIVPLIREKERLAIYHFRLHEAGKDRTPEHAFCLALYNAVEKDLNRCWTAPLN